MEIFVGFYLDYDSLFFYFIWVDVCFGKFICFYDFIIFIELCG